MASVAGTAARRESRSYLSASIDDAYGPDHDNTFVATGQIVARSGRTYTARGEHRHHKTALTLAAGPSWKSCTVRSPPTRSRSRRPSASAAPHANASSTEP